MVFIQQSSIQFIDLGQLLINDIIHTIMKCQWMLAFYKLKLAQLWLPYHLPRLWIPYGRTWDYTRQIMVIINSDLHTMFAATLFTMGTGKFQAASYLTAMAKGCHLVKINSPIIWASVSEPHIDSTAGTFHTMVRPSSDYNCYLRAAVGRTM